MACSNPADGSFSNLTADLIFSGHRKASDRVWCGSNPGSTRVLPFGQFHFGPGWKSSSCNATAAKKKWKQGDARPASSDSPTSKHDLSPAWQRHCLTRKLARRTAFQTCEQTARACAQWMFNIPHVHYVLHLLRLRFYAWRAPDYHHSQACHPLSPPQAGLVMATPSPHSYVQ